MFSGNHRAGASIAVGMTSLADRSDIVGTAERVRRRAEQHEPAFKTRALVDACFPTALVSGTRRLPSGITEAVSMTSEGPVILYERRLTVPRQRFVIAHALAHLLFDLEDPGAMCGVGHRGDPEAERRADDFAAELLLPLAWLHRLVGEEPTDVGESNDTLYMDQVDEIASMFNVTQSLVDSRIRSLFR